MWRLWFFLLLSLTSAEVEVDNQNSCNVLDCGAIGDGIANDTAAIQKCIDECSDGKTVVFPEDKQFLIGHITVSGACKHLHISSGSSLRASNLREAYPGKQDDWYMLLFDGCQECTLTGVRNSRLDGQAENWVKYEIPGDRKVVENWNDTSCPKPTECRPRMLGIRNSDSVVVDSVDLVNSIYWTLHVIHSRRVSILNSRIQNDLSIANNDGVDVDGSSDVFVGNVSVVTGDDAVCVKCTTPERSVENVLVRNCTLQSRSSAIKLGSESQADFKNITFEDINILPSHRGLGLQLRDQGSMDGITFRNIHMTTQLDNATWWGAGEAIMVSSLPRTVNQTSHGTVGSVRFQNIVAECEGGVVLVGSNLGHLLSVSMDNVRVSMRNMTNFPGGQRDLRPGPADIVRSVRVPAVYAEHVDHLALQDLSIVFPDGANSRPDWGNALEIETSSVRQVELQAVSVSNQTAVVPAPCNANGTSCDPADSAGQEGKPSRWHAGGIFMLVIFNLAWISMLVVSARQSKFPFRETFGKYLHLPEVDKSPTPDRNSSDDGDAILPKYESKRVGVHHHLAKHTA